MTQLLYAFSAMLLVAVMSISLHLNIMKEERNLFASELGAQMTGVANDVFEDMNHRSVAFDAVVNEYVIANVEGRELTFPITKAGGGTVTVADLTAEGDFGGCINYDSCASTRLSDIDNFHGLTFEVDSDGLRYEVSLVVRYVTFSEGSGFSSSSGTKTWFKEMEATITALSLVTEADPLQLKRTRVFAYDRTH